MIRLLFEQTVDAAVPELITNAVLANGRSADNTTALALVWEGEGDGATGAGVATDGLGEGSFTTTIIEEIPESEPQRDLTEDEIERTISEIKSAIERSNSR
jgi:PPM family protein phosphatase